MKKFISFLMFVVALAPFTAQAQQPAFSLPANAVEVAPNVFSLGKAYDQQTHSIVEGYAIVHKKGGVKNGSVKAPRGSSCYGYLAAGAKWKGEAEPWQINTANNSGLSGSFLESNTSANITKWENAANWDILGDGHSVTSAPTNKNVLDGVNEVAFGSIANNGTIAVTTIWGTFGGPPQNRRLVEWDQVFNTYYAWSDHGEANKMDYENISTHELGHSIGMDDIYTTSCSTVTMYGYGALGEITKRDLAPADITGISALY